MNTSGHKSIDPILWDVAQFVINNGDKAFDYIQSTFGIDEERASALIDYLLIVDIATITKFGLHANYFDRDGLVDRCSLIDFMYDNRMELKVISPKIKVLDDGWILSTNAKIDGYKCMLLMYIVENDLIAILRADSANTITDEHFVSQFIKDNFMNYFEYEEPHALMKYFPINFYDCAYDWYKKVLAKFIELDEEN